MLSRKSWFTDLLKRRASLKFAVLAAAVAIPGGTLPGPAGDAMAETQDNEINIAVAGVQVVTQTLGEGMEGLLPFNEPEKGTQVALLITSGDDRLIGVDQRRSNLQDFTDGQGMDLLEGEAHLGGPFGWPRVSDDHNAALLHISGPGIPARDASRIRAAGQLHVTTAKQTESVEAESVAIQQGTQFTAGDLELTIARIDDATWGDAEMSVRLRYTGSPHAIADIRFLDADGEQIEATQTGSGHGAMDGETQVMIDFDLKRKVPEATIEVDLWQDVQSREVPFEISTGLSGE